MLKYQRYKHSVLQNGVSRTKVQTRGGSVNKNSFIARNGKTESAPTEEKTMVTRDPCRVSKVQVLGNMAFVE